MDNRSTLPPTLPKGITLHHVELHARSVREARPIIEFEYSEHDDNEVILTIFGAERPGLLADLTDYLKSTSLHVRQANIYSLPTNSVIDQFILHDPNRILQHEDILHQLHDTLVQIINDNDVMRQPSRHQQQKSKYKSSKNNGFSTISNSPSREALYNYQLLGRRVPISLLAPRSTSPRLGNYHRISSNIALREVEEEHLLEYEASRRQREAITANFVEHAIATLTNGEYLYYYSPSHIRYRHRFFLSEDKTHLCWGDSNSIRLSRYAGCLFGPKSAVFQDLGNNLVDKEYLCFSLVPNTSNECHQQEQLHNPQTIDLVCVSTDQLNRWFLGLQSFCNPPKFSDTQRLTLDDITRLRIIYKIRAQAHVRGLTVRRFILKRVYEAGLRRNDVKMFDQYTDEIRNLEGALNKLQKNLVDHARRETLLNTSFRDFQTSWAIDPTNIQYLHPIGRGAFSEMWKAIWRSTPVALKRLTTHSFSGSQPFAGAFPSHSPKGEKQSVIGPDGDGRLSSEDRRLLQDFRLEVTMLNKLRHPNVVLFLGAVTELPNLCILTEFCHGGSLFNALRKRSWRTCLSLQELRHVARHIARGMCYLHSINIIHRDLKSQNLLLDRPVEEGCPVIKVADFGLSRKFSGIGTVTGSVAGIMTSETGTYRWMAPEMIRHEPYNEKVDVYSFAIVLWELFSCEIPFQSLSPIQAAYAVADKHLRPKCESDYAKDVQIPVAWQMLIDRCWHRSSHERPRFNEVLKTLDEMETCSNHEIPPSLQQKKDKNFFENNNSNNNNNNCKINNNSGPSVKPMEFKSSESTGESSNTRMDFDQEMQLTDNSPQTGFRRSGSSPAITNLKRQ